MKNLWLSAAGKRLKWLAEQKESVILSLLDKFKNHRTLTFCCSIEQSERLGKYNITSKNKDSINNLNMFNEGRIKHITACNILNEGVNLTNCRIGIFGNLNSSEIIVKQRVGRILRHKRPIIIIPYYKCTREEELVNKMLEEYAKESIITISNINEIKL
jgi:superfamily II DNA or RNA helicase